MGKWGPVHRQVRTPDWKSLGVVVLRLSSCQVHNEALVTLICTSLLACNQETGLSAGPFASQTIEQLIRSCLGTWNYN